MTDNGKPRDAPKLESGEDFCDDDLEVWRFFHVEFTVKAQKRFFNAHLRMP